MGLADGERSQATGACVRTRHRDGSFLSHDMHDGMHFFQDWRLAQCEPETADRSTLKQLTGMRGETPAWSRSGDGVCVFA